MTAPRRSANDIVHRYRRAPIYFLAVTVMVVAAGLLSPFRSGSQNASPDLSVQFTEVPGTLHAGKSVLVGFSVEVAALASAPFEARLWLVSSGVVGGPPALMATVRASRFGEFKVAAAVPAEPGNGPWKLRVEVDALPQEEVLDNNVAVSDDVTVLTFDLEVIDPSPIVFHPISTGDVLESSIEVVNTGSAGGVLVFTAEVVGAPPWLSITPPSSFAIGEGAPVPLLLRCDPALADEAALSAGEVTAMLRIASFDLPDDAVEIPVGVTLTPPVVSAGWVLVGSLSEGVDSDEFWLDGLKGQKVHLDLKVTAGKWSPRVDFVSPEGETEETLHYKTKKAKSSTTLVRRTHRLQQSGIYRLLVRDQSGKGGGYKVKIRRTLPKKARKRKLTLGAAKAGSIEIRALAGATLNLHLDPNSAFAGPVEFGLTTPGGAQYDMQAFVVPEGDAVLIKGLPIDQTGSYWVSVGGFGTSYQAKLRFVANPKNPPKQLLKLILP